MGLCVFDFDSTLMDGETIDFLAAPLGLQDQVAEITQMAMRGELDFFESLIMRVKLLEGLEVARVDEICRNLPYMPGAKETIQALKERGYKVVVFSGGFRNATAHARKVLGFDADFSNILHHRQGRLTGLVGGEMMFSQSKGEMLVRLQQLLDIGPEETIAVGDGANDLSMFAHAAKRVAFCAKQILKEEANIVIDRKDLRELLNFL
ncbi:MAG: phosphoserine phosphatase SerB [Nitratiruptor sp.]|nr:phosphoserine phosphatase SerB [Nitratiruptor sp.]NPA83622.1 phosphoserine phosphatase SerB [Campylobacterota bacterium]